ncbi:MAG: hypothetical protein HC794_00895 [Nitrospiraceae bacterium]|nr:hypothetical protein [Nitrospiraceae bacterium]
MTRPTSRTTDLVIDHRFGRNFSGNDRDASQGHRRVNDCCAAAPSSAKKQGAKATYADRSQHRHWKCRQR